MIRSPHDVQQATGHAPTRPAAGQPVPAPRTGSAERVPQQRTGTPALVVSRGPNEGAEFPLTGSVTVLGRHRECDIVLSDVTVSRYHTEIRREGDGYVICDAGSLNGTYLNRHVVDRAELSDGDEIWVGKVRFRFRT